ncbi:DUF1365 domain-containing protein [Albirhodobacter sp. R86504]|uniref:DUF1365 domain-containing protein n=1 Tax=Albirhodobacter sp. R86504 TaxID=3093848 RepID=UPI003670AB37
MGVTTTDLWSGALIDAKIWHARSSKTARREFTYHATYAAVVPEHIDAQIGPIAVDRAALWQIRRADYGAKGESLRSFADRIIGRSDLDLSIVTLPRSPLHGFNPVSFWLARAANGDLIAVIAEVSNTFNERHIYLVRHPDMRAITRSCRISGEKLFHVSPFLPREGRYEFRFDTSQGRFGAWVDWSNDTTTLQTSLTGRTRPLTASTVRRAAITAPLQSARIMALIHWQALKLFAQRYRFYSKPAPITPNLSSAESSTHVSPDAD